MIVKPNRKNIPCRLRVLFTVKKKFLLVLCLFDPSVPDVLDHMKAGGTQARKRSGCVLGPDWM